MEDISGSGASAGGGDDRPPICPACGVTMGIVVDDDGTTHHVCLECGFPDEQEPA